MFSSRSWADRSAARHKASHTIRVRPSPDPEHSHYESYTVTAGWPLMLVEMRTAAQAERVAEGTRCRGLPGKEEESLFRKVDVGDDLERHR